MPVLPSVLHPSACRQPRLPVRMPCMPVDMRAQTVRELNAHDGDLALAYTIAYL